VQPRSRGFTTTTDASSLCLGCETCSQAGVAIDARGNLWVTDTQHNRVLRFPNVAGVPAPTADLVLGQASFTNARRVTASHG
jgi:hypothetical protein